MKALIVTVVILLFSSYLTMIFMLADRYKQDKREKKIEIAKRDSINHLKIKI